MNLTYFIIALLLVLVIFEGIIIYILSDVKSNNKGKGDTSLYVSKEKHREILLRSEIQSLKREKEKLIRDNNSLEREKRELTRDNDKLKKLVGEEPAPSFTDTSTVDSHENSSQLSVQNPVSTETSNNIYVEEDDLRGGTSKEITMYASFPRTAGSSIYFSDLSENRTEESYFEFRISAIYGNATFKPIDFMKIRNYDPAMAAMLTEGVKPNVASTVLGIDPGKAHKDGKDWIIDKPAKIKLA